LTTAQQSAAEAHRKTASASTAQIAAYLEEMLGRALVAELAGVTPKSVDRWTKADAPEQPRREAEERLRAAFQIAQLLLSEESAHVVRAWMIGLNPQLDDEAPIEAIRAGRLREAMTAAKSYVRGG
jgi:hypothetical protein